MQEHEGLSLRRAALRLGVEKSTLSDWKKLLSDGTPLLSGMRKKSSHDGPLGQFAHIENELLLFIFELREQGMAVSSLMIVIKASILCAQFAAKSRVAKYAAVWRFVKAHSLVYRMGTNES